MANSINIEQLLEQLNQANDPVSFLRKLPNKSREALHQFSQKNINKQYENDEKATFKHIQDEPNENAFKSLYTKSLVNDQSLFDDSFKNFVVNMPEQRKMKYFATCTADYFANPNSSSANIILAGPPGTGKSHLAMAILRHVNNELHGRVIKPSKYVDAFHADCRFIDINELMLKIRSTFKSNSSLNEDDIISDLSHAYLLVLDDFGTELNGSNSSSNHMTFTQRVIYNVLNARSKTIITTNLVPSQIKDSYDPRIQSRLLQHAHIMNFQNIPDHRKYSRGSNGDSELPF